MNFLEFKKYLNNNNIYLFDSMYRIAYYRFNNINNNNMIGGKLNGNVLQHMIDSLLYNNKQKTNYILSLL